MDAKTEKINEAYSSEPWWYDARGFLILTFAYQSTLSNQIRLFSNNIKENHLEVAVGSGTLLDLILKWRQFKGLPIVKIIAFDYAENMLNGARKRFSKNPQIQLCRADASQMPWIDQQFESVNIANAIHCFPDIKGSLAEVYRVLKTDGTLAGNCLLYPSKKSWLNRIAIKINNWGMKKGILHRPYTQVEIKNLLQQIGFNLVYERISGNCYDFIAQKN